MRVAAVTHWLSRAGGGIPPAMQRLYAEAAQLPRVDVTAIGLADDHSAEDAAAWSPVPTIGCAVKGPGALGYAPALSSSLTDASPDVVHTHGCWMYTSAQVAQWHATTGRPYVVSPHGMLDPWALRNSRWKKRVAWHWFERRHLKRAACLHALTVAEARALRDLGLTQPICVIPNGVDVEAPDPGDPAADGDGTPTVLFLGRLHPKKGIAELLTGWSQFARGHAPWRLRIAGWDDGGHAAALQAQARALGVEGSVEFVGPQFGEAKRRAFAEADAFILPSFSEGLPMTVLEAWARGVPVIMSDHCNLPEGFAAAAAVRVEPQPESIAAGLVHMASLDGAARRQMGEAGRHLAASRFSWPAIAADMVGVYRWLMGEGPRPESVVSL